MTRPRGRPNIRWYDEIKRTAELNLMESGKIREMKVVKRDLYS